MSDDALTVAVTGAGGRMGQSVIRLAQLEGCRLVGAVERAASPSLGRDAGELAGLGVMGVQIAPDISSALLGARCVIDFSSAESVVDIARVAARAGVAFVSGTTGLDAAAEKALDEAAKRIPVLWSPNMSVGIHVLAELVKAAARALEGFDVEIVETHHKLKVDAPSGTAKRLLEAVREVREARMVSGREGKPGARFADEVGVLAVRGGDIIGDHTVHLFGPGEHIELTHRATNRDLFARGALRAAKAIAGKKPGRYVMSDVVGQ
jgi:4-hydroxy-tetrahydrodipicolinate reductase